MASDVINAVKSNKFYILTHPHTKAGIQIRMEDILQERAPTLLPILNPGEPIMPQTNRVWRLKTRPVGNIKTDDFDPGQRNAAQSWPTARF